MDDIEKLAYATQCAYRSCTNKKIIAEVVKENFPSADINIIRGMIEAIDSYVDYNDEPLKNSNKSIQESSS